jgi:hypothetical protein
MGFRHIKTTVYVLQYTHFMRILYFACNRSEVAMAQEKTRMNLQVSPEVSKILSSIAHETGSNRTEGIRQALALMKVAHDAKRRGQHIGLASDPTKLETEIVGLL